MFEFVRENQALFAVARMCRVLGVSTSGYYAWRKGPASGRRRKDAVLLARIREIHQGSRQTYGAPRIHAQLRQEGTLVSRKRVARLMKKAGLKGVCRRRWPRTTVRCPGAPVVSDLVQRDFSAAAPDQLWVADITWVPTRGGFLYLAVVMDAFSRRIVGWSMKTHLKMELVTDALHMAIEQRQPPMGVIHHSDQGCQYTSIEFGKHCRLAGVRPSQGSVGDCYDNALCESFFATLECELIDRFRWDTVTQAQRAVFDFIEGWYNPHRLHSALGYVSPALFERRYHDRQSTAN